MEWDEARGQRDGWVRQTQNTLTERLWYQRASPSKSALFVDSRSEKAFEYQNPS